MSTRFVIALEYCNDPALAGGKAVGLAHLLKQGFAVPSGFCLTTDAYHTVLSEKGIDDEARWRGLQRLDESLRALRLDGYRREVAGLQLPTGIMSELDMSLDRMGRGGKAETLWAVRSSATCEDLTEGTSAGMFRTELGVPRRLIGTAVAACWASLWTPHVWAYGRRLGWSSVPRMAVVIQPLLEPRAAGVAYSRHPLTGRTDQVMINAVYGLAEPLVTGAIMPDSYLVQIGRDARPERIAAQHIAAKPTVRTGSATGPMDRPVPPQDQDKACLDEHDILAVAEHVKRIEQSFGYPVDVEWAIEDRHLWILQARPISPLRIEGELTERTCLWSRANFKETLPEVPSPLGLSLLERFMEEHIVRRYLELGCDRPHEISSLRVMQGRPYINVTLFQSFTRQLGGDPDLVVEQMGGQGYAVPTPRRPPKRRVALKAACLMEWRIRAAARRASGWFAEMKDLAGRIEAIGPDRSLADLLAHLRRTGERLRDRDLTFAIVAGVSQSLQALRVLLERPVGRQWRSWLNGALQGLGTVVSAEHIIWLRVLAETARLEPVACEFFCSEPFQPQHFRSALAGTRVLRDLDSFLAEYGHRAIGESDVMTPRFRENPGPLLSAVQAAVKQPPDTSVADLLRARESVRRAALTQIERRLRWYALPLFRWWYRRLSRYLALREANRHHLMYITTAMRSILLAMGEVAVREGRLQAVDDLFFLTAEEIEELAGDTERSWLGLIAERRLQLRRHASLTVPDHVVLGTMPLQSVHPADAGLEGIPASVGSAEGPVCLVRSPQDFRKVKRGDILVVPVIDPGMAPLFAVAAGLVAEMGGTLSHGAIMVREYGLPAIVNVQGITRLVADGDRIAVDAETGTVTRLERRS